MPVLERPSAIKVSTSCSRAVRVPNSRGRAFERSSKLTTSGSTTVPPPTIVRSQGRVINGVVGITVDTDSSAQRVFVLYKGSGTTGKAGGGPYYVTQYLREQSRTVIEE